MDLQRAKEFLDWYNKLFYNNIWLLVAVICFSLLLLKLIKILKNGIWSIKEKNGQSTDFFSKTYARQEVLGYIGIYREDEDKENAMTREERGR